MVQDPKPATRAKNKYRNKVYDQINLVVSKGKKAELQAYADSKGESLNGFVNRAIDETMERDRYQIEDIPITLQRHKPDGKGGWITVGIKEIEVPIPTEEEAANEKA